MLCSGHEEGNAPHTQGVALVLFKEAHNALIGWESHGSRIIRASFKSNKQGVKISAVQCYSLIKDSNEDVKDQFYDRLQSVVVKYPGRDLTCQQLYDTMMELAGKFSKPERPVKDK
ncbi:unnamed protein product [Schistosoma mattheei]|uniref:Uncharacterized protein n=1 Tax=Schistosoma mattheei TaxID=31246 RepID=A0A183NLR8_9TREM|nr:unnamed protein product [Schistosoma mattheei]